jgi:hypothetical protein
MNIYIYIYISLSLFNEDNYREKDSKQPSVNNVSGRLVATIDSRHKVHVHKHFDYISDVEDYVKDDITIK